MLKAVIPTAKRATITAIALEPLRREVLLSLQPIWPTNECRTIAVTVARLPLVVRLATPGHVAALTRSRQVVERITAVAKEKIDA
jgi:hypothetical protein